MLSTSLTILGGQNSLVRKNLSEKREEEIKQKAEGPFFSTSCEDPTRDGLIIIKF
jgi:hypothetical protein